MDKNHFQDVKYDPIVQENVDKSISSQNENNKTDTLYLRFTVITALLTFMTGGTQIAWTSPAILKMQSNDTNINPLGRLVETHEISKFFLITGMTSLLGSLIVPKLADKMGRKKSLWFLAMFILISLIGLSLSRNINLMIACATTATILFGGCISIVPMYLTEICEDHNRAKYGCLMSAFLPVGQLYTYLIGPLFSYTIFTLLTGIPLVLFMIMFCFAPESPVFSLQKGRRDECEQTLRKLRSNKTEKELEYDILKISQTLKTTSKNSGLALKQLFCTKEGGLGLTLASLPLLVQFSTGVPIMMMLMAPIFSEFGSNISGSTIAIYVGIVKIFLFVSTSLVVERFGRRPLLLMSGCGTALPVTVLGVCFYLKHTNSTFVNEYPWVPLFCVLAYIAMYSIGLGPVSISIMGEMFPSNTRSIGCAIVNTFTAMFLTLYVSAYPIMAELVGTHWCMWMFGTCSFCGALLIYFLLPETKGKSVLEIQEILKSY